MTSDLVTRHFGPRQPVSFTRRIPVCQQLTLGWIAKKHQAMPVGHVFTTDGECIYDCGTLREDPNPIAGPFGTYHYVPGESG